MADSVLYLAPVPKELTYQAEAFSTKNKRYIRLDADDPQELILAVEMTGLDWEITASPKAPKEKVGLVIRTDSSSDIASQGYQLTVTPDAIEITAKDREGAFYGACTLAQILRQANGTIPCLSISDWPDFPARGVMLDVSRDKVPTMETLYDLVDLLASWKINQIQLYTEHTFAYLAHAKVWEHASPMTGEEVMLLDAYCKSRYIELVPNQNSFGHMERWLKHEEYLPLAEAPDGCETEWGFRGPFGLCAVDEKSIPFLKSLYDELLPHFSSRMFNVGCDETIDLGCARSKKACEEKGKGRVYLEFLQKIAEIVHSHGRTMQFWGDIIMNHLELLPELPDNIIAMEWGYECDHPFEDHCEKFSESNIPFYVCPGTSTWLTLSGRTENAIASIESAARNGLNYGAIGLLNTDWGDWGHWQPLSVSYLPLLAGAMLSWNAKPDIRPTLAPNVSLHAFGDPTGKIGKAYYELGEIYRCFNRRSYNSSIPFQVLFWTDKEGTWKDVTLAEFESMEKELERIKGELQGDKMALDDAEIVRMELQHVLNMLALSAEIGRNKLAGTQMPDFESKLNVIEQEHQHVWLLRNRPGGLSDSTARLRQGEL